LSSESYHNFVCCTYDHVSRSVDAVAALDEMLDFLIRLRHSYVDNDKPVSSFEEKWAMCMKVWGLLP